MSTSPDEQINLIETLIREGRLEEANKLAQELENDENLDVEENLKARKAQLSILILKKDLEKAIKLADIIVDLSKELKLPLINLDGLLLRAEAQLNLRFFDESQQDLTIIEELLSQIEGEKDNEILKQEFRHKLILGEWFAAKYDYEQSLHIITVRYR